MASLRDAQSAFARALREPAPAAGDAGVRIEPAANLAIYRNNAVHAFESALASSFPVLRRRVGEDYFRQLAFHYRARFPSRSGDLHWVGERFAEFLDEHLARTDYAWLADLARLEWAREAASVSAELPEVAASGLARVAPDQLEHLRFRLQPSLRLISSSYPVFSVWFANQATDASPVDQSQGPEQGLARLRYDTTEIRQLDPELFAFLYALVAGDSLGDAVAAAALDERRLTAALGFVFGEGLVTWAGAGDIVLM